MLQQGAIDYIGFGWDDNLKLFHMTELDKTYSEQKPNWIHWKS